MNFIQYKLDNIIIINNEEFIEGGDSEFRNSSWKSRQIFQTKCEHSPRISPFRYYECNQEIMEQ